MTKDEIYDRNACVVAAYKEGYTLKECALMFRISIGSVRHALTVFRVSPRLRSYRSKSNKAQRIK